MNEMMSMTLAHTKQHRDLDKMYEASNNADLHVELDRRFVGISIRDNEETNNKNNLQRLLIKNEIEISVMIDCKNERMFNFEMELREEINLYYEYC